jgi:hypothetical protein
MGKITSRSTWLAAVFEAQLTGLDNCGIKETTEAKNTSAKVWRRSGDQFRIFRIAWSAASWQAANGFGTKALAAGIAALKTCSKASFVGGADGDA